MKNIIIGVATLAILHIGDAVAATCTVTSCPENMIPNVPSDVGCKDAGSNLQWRCFYNSKGVLVGPFQFCMGGCKDGYTQVSDNNYLPTQLGCANVSVLNIWVHCVSNTVLCGTCVSDAWVEIPNMAYATRTQRYCDGATCKSSSQVGCKTGYYGTPTKVGSGCTKCPNFGSISGTTNGVGATSVAECYVTSGTFCDATGCGTCNGNAYYVN